jgi:hypothetical protein
LTLVFPATPCSLYPTQALSTWRKFRLLILSDTVLTRSDQLLILPSHSDETLSNVATTIFVQRTFKEPLVEVCVICAYHCLLGQKVKFSVANADGTPAPGSSPASSPPDTTASSHPPPAARNATSANPFGFRNDAAGIARFGWFTIAVVCALSCYNIL